MRIIPKFFKTVIFLLLFWLLSYLIYTMFLDFLDDYDVFNTEDTPAIVIEKVSVNNFFGLPKYYAIVDLNNVDGYNGVKNRVFPWHFKRLDVGDSLKGHHIHGEHFFTTYDIVMDSFWFILIMLLLLFFMAALLLWPIITFSDWRQAKNKSPPLSKQQKRQKKQQKKVSDSFLKRILPKKMYQVLTEIVFDSFNITITLFLTALLVSSVFATGFFVNGLHKLSPLGKTQTTAYIEDKEVEREIFSFVNSKYSDPYYTLELSFIDEKGDHYRVIKEVTRSTYVNHDLGDSIAISYWTSNPYHLFIRGFSVVGFLQFYPKLRK